MSDALKTLLLLPVLLVVMFVAVWASPGKDARLHCVTGDAARNPVGQTGNEVPQYGVSFDTLAAGEAFICLDTPQLEEVDGWFVSGVNAFRSHSLDRFQPRELVTGDDGYRFLAIGYLNRELEGLIMFDFTAYPQDLAQRLNRQAPNQSACQILGPPTSALGELLEETTARVNGADASVRVYAEARGQANNLFVCWQRGGLTYSAYARYGSPLDYRRDILPFLETLR